MSYIEFKKVEKEYRGEVNVLAVKDCSFEINRGELVAILGQSGAGKTTILNMLGGMDSPTKGSIFIDGTDIAKLSNRKLVKYRRNDIGFVFQFYNLVANLTAVENVELACQLCKDAFDPVDIMKEVGLGKRMKSFPSQLSGGEQQRVAIARAIAKNPKILLCDEPTGALDSETGKRIIELIQTTCHTRNVTTIIVTHNSDISKVCDKVIRIKNGTVDKIKINENPLQVSDIDW
ncbi:MAG: ABC transporter ATP-binding protein [Eubacterium sp.]|nr:ABC transporter ATP-binding protein [Eubacterium sp.]